MFEYTREVEFSVLLLIDILMSIIAIVISSYLAFLYIKMKEFHSFACGFIIALSFSIPFDNILKLTPINSNSSYKVFQSIQAVLLALSDKFILLVLIGQALIIYFGEIKVKVYSRRKKVIFYSILFGSLGLSFLMGLLYLLFGVSKYGIYFYIEAKLSKKIIDTIFNSILLVGNTFLYFIIIFTVKKIDVEKESLDIKKKHIRKMILMFIANSLMFIEYYFIIWCKLPFSNIGCDLIYAITCLIINLIYAVNEKIIKETKKIFSRKKTYLEEKNNTNTFGSYSEELPNRSSTFSDDE